ncbi:MAG: ATP-binding protein [bacterium]
MVSSNGVKIRAGRFKGIKGLDFIDMKVLEGAIPELREKAMNFMVEHINHGVFFDANRRYDKWEYPLRALEEVLNNALAHRDYFSNAEIHLSIYDDRIEVWNPGELPPPLTPEDLKREHKSIPRNKFLADKLFLIKYIEEWGRGTNRIIDEMRENKLPEPEFKSYSGGFAVILHGPGKSFEEKIEKEKLHYLEINKRQGKAIEYLKTINFISTMVYMELNKVSDKTAFLELKDMLAKNILIKEGKGRATIYKLKK